MAERTHKAKQTTRSTETDEVVDTTTPVSELRPGARRHDVTGSIELAATGTE